MGRVSLRRVDRTLLLTVANDGAPERRPGGGSGLRSIGHRVRDRSGTLSVQVADSAHRLEVGHPAADAD